VTFILNVFASVVATILCAFGVYVWKKSARAPLTIGPLIISRKSSLPQATFYKDNQTAADEEIKKYIRSRTIHKAVVVQYSCNNVEEILRALWEKDGVSIDVYMANPDRKKYVISDWQTTWINQFLSKYKNNLILDHRGHQTQLDIYLYDAPASPRVIMLNDELMVFGCYFYEWKKDLPDGSTGLDVRGGDKPVMVIHGDNPSFAVLHKEVTDMVTNWKQNKVARFYETYPKPEASAAGSAITGTRGRRPAVS